MNGPFGDGDRPFDLVDVLETFVDFLERDVDARERVEDDVLRDGEGAAGFAA